MKEEPTVHYWSANPRSSNDNWYTKYHDQQREDMRAKQESFNDAIRKMAEDMKQQRQHQEEYARKMYGNWDKQNTGTDDLIIITQRHQREKAQLEAKHRAELDAFWNKRR